MEQGEDRVSKTMPELLLTVFLFFTKQGVGSIREIEVKRER